LPRAGKAQSSAQRAKEILLRFRVHRTEVQITHTTTLIFKTALLLKKSLHAREHLGSDVLGSRWLTLTGLRSRWLTLTLLAHAHAAGSSSSMLRLLLAQGVERLALAHSLALSFSVACA